jgi:hypothetical protein
MGIVPARNMHLTWTTIVSILLYRQKAGNFLKERKFTATTGCDHNHLEKKTSQHHKMIQEFINSSMMLDTPCGSHVDSMGQAY